MRVDTDASVDARSRVLRTATSRLAIAYAAVFASNGTTVPAARAAAAAAGKISAACPGAAQ
jgi:hypothetical protein